MNTLTMIKLCNAYEEAAEHLSMLAEEEEEDRDQKHAYNDVADNLRAKSKRLALKWTKQ